MRWIRDSSLDPVSVHCTATQIQQHSTSRLTARIYLYLWIRRSPKPDGIDHWTWLLPPEAYKNYASYSSAMRTWANSASDKAAPRIIIPMHLTGRQPQAQRIRRPVCMKHLHGLKHTTSWDVFY